MIDSNQIATTRIYRQETDRTLKKPTSQIATTTIATTTIATTTIATTTMRRKN
jgi:hypothetical protein